MNLKDCTMKYNLIIFLSFLLGFSSCTYYVYPPDVKYRTEKEYIYKDKLIKDYELSKWLKISRKEGYERFDEKGNVIEKGYYGEHKAFGSITINADSSIIGIVSGDGWDNKKLGTVCYFQFDSTNKKISEEVWNFKDNKKDHLFYKTLFEYDSNGKLVKEIEYDRQNNIHRIQDYSFIEENLTVLKDTDFSFSYDGTTKVEKVSQDTIKTDSLGRTIEKIHYYDDKFLYREVFRYDHFNEIVTKLRYDDKPDRLWSITEWQYDIVDDQLVRRFWKVIGGTVENKDIYIYNRKKLLTKIIHYKGEEVESYTKYKYKLF
jgi:hypothetical protein